MDVVVMVTFLACLTAPVLRVAQQYACSQEGPGPQPSEQRRFDPRSLHVTPKNTGSSTTSSRPSGSDSTVPLWPGAVSAERQARTACAFVRAGDTVLAGAFAAAFAGPALMSTELEALGQTGLVIVCACVLAFPTALGVLPVLFSLGFSPSRVWLKAFFIFWNRQFAATA